MAFRGDHTVRANHSGFARFYQLPMNKEPLAFRCEIFAIGSGLISIISTVGRSDSTLRFYCAPFPAVITGSGAK